MGKKDPCREWRGDHGPLEPHPYAASNVRKDAGVVPIKGPSPIFVCGYEGHNAGRGLHAFSSWGGIEPSSFSNTHPTPPVVVFFLFASVGGFPFKVKHQQERSLGKPDGLCLNRGFVNILNRALSKVWQIVYPFQCRRRCRLF